MASLFAESVEPALLVHGSYHKMGTVYVQTTLSQLCQKFGIELLSGTQEELTPSTQMFFQNGSLFDIDTLPPFRGSHIVRDLRDVVASGYKYHLWTDEHWVVRPMSKGLQRRIGSPAQIEPGMSYRELLNTVPEELGILLEMRRVSRGIAERFRAWNWHDPRFIELRFEDLVSDGGASFERIFRHFGLRDDIVEAGVRIARGRSLESMQKLPEEKRPPHTKGGGGSGKWRAMFTDEHIATFKELMNDALVLTGYETDDSW